MQNNLKTEYFKWLFDSICGDLYPEKNSYKKLLAYLHDIEFRYLMPADMDRAEDGILLRRRFALTFGDDQYAYVVNSLNGPCSVLEMMIALTRRCEETIMDEPDIGDRTRQWFWGMITSLGLGSMNDARFNETFVCSVVNRFLNREYEPNGRGGLFMIRNCNHDLRNVEIWHQLCWYLNSIT